MTDTTITRHAHAGINAADPETYARRLADWRMHQVVYQVFPDRFFAHEDVGHRAQHYPAPARLKAWTDQPRAGQFLEDFQIWEHEAEFWGGTLRGVLEKLDHIVAMGANVLYLNPVFLARSNHKYDATDYHQIDPQLGTEQDLQDLCDACHARGLRVVLDGVFNHTGRMNRWFQAAESDPASPYRDWYTFDADGALGHPHGYAAWWEAANLPELNYETPAVCDAIYGAPDSVVRRWLGMADGWRLDVAFDLGPDVLAEITAATRQARPDGYVVGENYNYPSGWVQCQDGILNMTLAFILFGLVDGRISGPKASAMIGRMVDDTGIEGLLRSWITLTNHDRPRLKTTVPDLRDRTFLWQLMVTLPGAPLLYYGEELGFEGGDDPEMRAPMDWVAVAEGTTPELALIQRLLGVRNGNDGLKVGDCVILACDHLLGFVRHTASVRDTVVVLANPTQEPVTETVLVPDAWLMNMNGLTDLFSNARVMVAAGLLTVTVPPRTVRAFAPVISATGYSPYKRVP
ncbi:MAG: glycoside hydrolase family 13 protein [Hyphomonadaceae bacterium]|nr:glycoside hydrolase family 13 protein [Hyphomonadaceae bacterium]